MLQTIETRQNQSAMEDTKHLHKGDKTLKHTLQFLEEIPKMKALYEKAKDEVETFRHGGAKHESSPRAEHTVDRLKREIELLKKSEDKWRLEAENLQKENNKLKQNLRTSEHDKHDLEKIKKVYLEEKEKLDHEEETLAQHKADFRSLVDEIKTLDERLNKKTADYDNLLEENRKLQEEIKAMKEQK